MLQLIIFYGMFAVLLVLIGLSLRESIMRTSRAMTALIDIGRKDSEAAQKAADAAQKAVALLEKKERD